MAKVIVNGVEVTDAMTPQERFNAISRSMGGAVVGTLSNVRDPWMERWKTAAGGDQTLAYLRKNEERIAQGLPPLRADGTELTPAQLQPIPSFEPTATPGDDFWSK